MANEKIIICGFSGIGKSTVTKNNSNFIDVESSNFSWTKKIGEKQRNDDFPKNYIDHVEDLIKNSSAKYILLSCHQIVRDELQKRNIKYVIVMPTQEQKDEYLKRWIVLRQEPMSFVKKMSDNWDDMIFSCLNDSSKKIFLQENQYFSDIINNELM